MIKIGDYVKLGRYNKEEILWQCIKKNETSVTMVSDKVLFNISFDEKK